MATIKFRLSSKADKSTGRCEVLVRFFHGHIDQYAKTNVFVSPERWNSKAERLTVPRVRVMTEEAKALVGELSDLNTRLEAIKEYINKAFIDAGAGKTALAGDWLSKLINEYNFPKVEDSKFLLPSLQAYIDSRVDISVSRKKHFEVLWRTLKRYLITKDLSLNYPVDSLNTDFISGFVKYLQVENTYYRIETDGEGNKTTVFLNHRFEKALKAVPESRLPEPRGINAINHFLNDFRNYTNYAVRTGKIAKNPFTGFKYKKPKYGDVYYLTLEERDRLYKYDFGNDHALATQRDIFIFQCVIGCRVSDLRSFTKSSVNDGELSYIPRKTKDNEPVVVAVPLNKIANEILARYKDLPGDKLLPFISDQRYNDHIKEMFKKAGLDRVVTILNPTTREYENRHLYEIASSHLARRTFIGNLYKKVKDPDLIASLSGHVEGSKAFARYRKIDKDDQRTLVTYLD